MNITSLTVTAQLKAKPGQADTVRQALLSLVAPSRKDAGCVNYDLHQSTENPALFLFHETWTNQALLDLHLQTPHVQSTLDKLGPLLTESPQITLWEKLT